MKKLVLFLILILSLSVYSQQGEIAKDSTVVPKFTAKSLIFDKLKVWSLRKQYSAVISQTANGEYAINGHTDWAASDFPLIADFRVRELDISKKKDSRLLLIAEGIQIEILIPPSIDPNQAFASLLFNGSVNSFINSPYFQGLEKRLLPKIFGEKLAAIPLETQQALMRGVNYNGNVYGSEVFKERVYFTVNFSDNIIYNTIQINQAERASRQTESALKQIKAVFLKTQAINEIHGIKVATVIQSRDFLREKYIEPHKERFEMFTPFELIQKFIDADITNQEMVDGSIILIDGSRVKVNLTNFSN